MGARTHPLFDEWPQAFRRGREPERYGPCATEVAELIGTVRTADRGSLDALVPVIADLGPGGYVGGLIGSYPIDAVAREVIASGRLDEYRHAWGDAALAVWTRLGEVDEVFWHGPSSLVVEWAAGLAGCLVVSDRISADGRLTSIAATLRSSIVAPTTPESVRPLATLTRSSSGRGSV